MTDIESGKWVGESKETLTLKMVAIFCRGQVQLKCF